MRLRRRFDRRTFRRLERLPNVDDPRSAASRAKTERDKPLQQVGRRRLEVKPRFPVERFVEFFRRGKPRRATPGVFGVAARVSGVEENLNSFLPSESETDDARNSFFRSSFFNVEVVYVYCGTKELIP